MAQQTVAAVQPNPAEIYDRHFVPQLMNPCADLLLHRVPPRSGERMLDIACGTGIVSRKAAPLVGPTGSIVGADISQAMLQVAESLPAPEGATISWQESNGIDLPYSDASFDLVLCQQGLQFMPDRQAAANEMRRVLVSGGRVGVAVWAGPEHQPFFGGMTEIINRHIDAPVAGLPLSLGSCDELRSLLEAAGFKDVSIEQVSFTSRVPSADTFVRLGVMGAASVLPEFGKMDDEAKSALVEVVQADSAELLRAHLDGDGIAYSMAANIASAYV
jgi:ubiquinone/menaquinone biosynthesis C-methylase UbiE